MAKVLGSVAITTPQLLDQKVTNDTSDYLWYIIRTMVPTLTIYKLVLVAFNWCHKRMVLRWPRISPQTVWSYKVGMHGENMKLYSPGITEGWFANGLPTDKIFMWYKTTFRTPIGTDPVVLDLKGSGKGQAWVNGTMSQTHFFVMVRITHWFCLKNPFEVKIASVTIAKACAKAYEGHALELACKENQVISEIKFASFDIGCEDPYKIQVLLLLSFDHDKN
ncbi:hypothetical protein JHK84_045599 [Glycine max]|nr:hypothetical protein JHK84_045599 [Glycine max]